MFGTSAPSYVKTAFCNMRQTAKDSIDPRFEIDRARNEIASLQPAFDQNKEVLARAEVAAERLNKEIGEVQASLDHQKATIVALRDQVKKGDYRLTGHVVGTADEAKARLAHRLDQFKATESVLKEKHELLKAKHQMIESAHSQLETLKTQKQALLTRLANIEARLSLIEASQSKSEFNFDSSALARARRPSPAWKSGWTSCSTRPRSTTSTAISTAMRSPASIRSATWSRRSTRRSARPRRPRPATRACEVVSGSGARGWGSGVRWIRSSSEPLAHPPADLFSSP